MPQRDARGKSLNANVSAPIPFAAAETSPPPSASASGSAAPVGTTDEVRLGARLGKYQIVRLLGRGGMGAVYEAMDVALHRKVALKILPHEFSLNEESLKRFIREARLAARLNHPNAVAVYDVGKKGTIYYIAMELVRGASGQQLLDESRALSWRDATVWMADACRALAAAHAAGLIHRDVKPSNMLRSDESGSIKISDFGLAKPTDAKKNLTLTQKDAFIGTPLFMSPEQCRNDGVDARSDLYSLGATYYTLLTGRPPYSSGTALQILFAHCSAPIPDARDAVADLPDGCAVIAKKAMAKDPNERYQTAEQMLADLERVLRGEAVDADPTLAAMNDLLPAMGSTTDLLPAPAPLWQSGSAMPSRDRHWASVGIVAGAILLVGGGILAVLIARSGATSDTKPGALAAAAVEAPRVAQIVSPPEPSVSAAPVAQSVALETNAAPVALASAAPATQALSTPPAPAANPATLPVPAPANAPATAPAAQAKEPPAPAPPMDEESVGADLPDTIANRPLRVYLRAKLWARRAKESGNATAIEKGARALMLWHDFFAQSPHAEHVAYAEESEKLAEQYVPGIAGKPRVQPGVGPPLPPTPPAKPRADEPPPKGEKPPARPPLRRPTR